MPLPDGISRSVVDLFGLLYRKLIRKDADRLTIHTSSQSAVLSVLLRNEKQGPTKMSDIGKTLNVSKPNITFLIDKIEKQGLIVKKQSETDRRIQYIYLTDLGKKVIKERKQTLHNRIRLRLEELSSEDLFILKSAMDASISILRKLSGNVKNDGDR